jgi:hypothetical protein
MKDVDSFEVNTCINSSVKHGSNNIDCGFYNCKHNTLMHVIPSVENNALKCA